MSEWWWLAAVVPVLVGVAAWRLRRPLRERRWAAEYVSARRDFHLHRERLEAKFVQLAGASGKPRGLRWTNCDFDDAVAYARDRQSAVLCAFVGVTISFEAIEGGGMEEVEAVGNLRAATAVFRFVGGRWSTDGRAVFNLNPSETNAHFRNDLVLVGQETIDGAPPR
jgi:hypothetical protein